MIFVEIFHQTCRFNFAIVFFVNIVEQNSKVNDSDLFVVLENNMKKGFSNWHIVNARTVLDSENKFLLNSVYKNTFNKKNQSTHLYSHLPSWIFEIRHFRRC